MTFTASGHIGFSGKMKQDRSVVEQNCEAMLLDLCLYAQDKYPDFVWESSPVSLYQKVRGLVKVRD